MKKIMIVLAAMAVGTAAWADKAAKTDKPDASYPLTTCVVSGEALEGGDMGGPVHFVYKGRDVWFCCPHCKKDFLKDPEKYLKKIDDAAKAKAAKAAPAS